MDDDMDKLKREAIEKLESEGFTNQQAEIVFNRVNKAYADGFLPFRNTIFNEIVSLQEEIRVMLEDVFFDETESATIPEITLLAKEGERYVDMEESEETNDFKSDYVKTLSQKWCAKAVYYLSKAIESFKSEREFDAIPRLFDAAVCIGSLDVLLDRADVGRNGAKARNSKSIANKQKAIEWFLNNSNGKGRNLNRTKAAEYMCDNKIVDSALDVIKKHLNKSKIDKYLKTSQKQETA